LVPAAASRRRDRALGEYLHNLAVALADKLGEDWAQFSVAGRCSGLVGVGRRLVTKLRDWLQIWPPDTDSAEGPPV
jgi:hypothetical protein